MYGIPTVVVIMCGPPASGKTTFIKKKYVKTFTTFSRDEIRDFDGTVLDINQ